MLGVRQVVLRRKVYGEIRHNGINLLIPIYAARQYPTSLPPYTEAKEKKTIKCLGETPRIAPRCPKTRKETCPSQGKLKVPPLPSECQTEESGPVYDKMCQRPYRNPCYSDMKKPCKCDMIPQRCLAPCMKKKRSICYGEPECAQEMKIDWGLRIRQILLGLGALLGGLMLYRVYGSEKKMEILSMKRDRRFRRPMEIIKIPDTSDEIPSEIDYLLIGGGTAAYAAQKAIRKSVKGAKILIVSNGPPFFPAMKPPLSSQLWTEPDRERALDLEFVGPDKKSHSIMFEPPKYYTPVQELATSKGGVGIAQGWTVKKLDPGKRKAFLEDGKDIKYKKCLLATGGRPKILPPFDEAEEDVLEKVTFFSNSFDFQELEEIIQMENVKCIAVIGGGLLGTEMVAALRERTKDLNVKIINIIKDHGNLSKILPSYLSVIMTKILSERGIHIVHDAIVEDVARVGTAIKLYTSNEKVVTVEHVIVATGIEPNVDLAKDTCLELDPVNGGFAVNSEMSSCTDLYAAGDSASFYDCKLGRRREEHYSHAIATGQIAGENMAGKAKKLEIQPSFKCSLAPDYTFEGTGRCDTSYPTVAIFPNSRSRPVPVETANENGNGNGSENGNGNGNHEEMSAKSKYSRHHPVNLSDKKNSSKGDHRHLSNGKSDHVRVEENGDVDDATLSNADFHKGVIFYLNSQQEIVGVLTLNLPGKINIGKVIVNGKRKYDDIDEITKLFGLHDGEKN